MDEYVYTTQRAIVYRNAPDLETVREFLEQCAQDEEIVHFQILPVPHLRGYDYDVVVVVNTEKRVPKGL